MEYAFVLRSSFLDDIFILLHDATLCEVGLHFHTNLAICRPLCTDKHYYDHDPSHNPDYDPEQDPDHDPHRGPNQRP